MNFHVLYAVRTSTGTPNGQPKETYRATLALGRSGVSSPIEICTGERRMD